MINHLIHQLIDHPDLSVQFACLLLSSKCYPLGGDPLITMHHGTARVYRILIQVTRALQIVPKECGAFLRPNGNIDGREDSGAAGIDVRQIVDPSGHSVVDIAHITRTNAIVVKTVEAADIVSEQVNEVCTMVTRVQTCN